MADRTITFSCDHADQRTPLYCPHSAPHSLPGVEPPVVAGYYCYECGAMDIYEPWCFCNVPTNDSFLTQLEAQRDQLDQQVRELLSAEAEHRASYPITYDRELAAAADKVRKERGQ